jgi:hypothetical protein
MTLVYLFDPAWIKIICSEEVRCSVRTTGMDFEVAGGADLSKSPTS